jgi:Tol biopolymer transport system component
VISVLGGTPRKLQDHGSTGLVSPDGSQIAFNSQSDLNRGFDEIWIMGSGGEQPRNVLHAPKDQGVFLRDWSADGRRITYLQTSEPNGLDRAAIESFDLKASKITTLVSDPRLIRGMWWSGGGVCWMPDGRLVYSRYEPPPDKQDANLWELRVSSRTGEPVGEPKKITHWSGTAVWNLNPSADGRRLAVLRANLQADVYIGQLEAGGTRMKTPRRLTLDERNDVPGPWMPDSKTVTFSSNRNGSYDIFKQAIYQSTAEALVTGPDDKFPTAVTPGGQWLLYSARKDANPSAPIKIMRIPISGGPPEFVFDAGVGFVQFTCARSPSSNVCALNRVDQTGQIFSPYDQATRKMRDFAKVEKAADWDIFP